MTEPTIVFPLYPGVTQLDFTGPHQFLSRLPQATVIAASLGGRDIAADGLILSGLAPLEEIATCDVLCVPGGGGCTGAMRDPGYMAAITRLAASARYVTSVCTGSLILAAAGLLDGRRAACHWAWRDLLAEFGAIPDPGRVVRDGRFLTGGGVTAGIDFALALIAELRGVEAAQEIQLALEYAPAPPFPGGRPETTPAPVLDRVLERMKPLRAEREQAVRAAAARRH